MLYVFLGVYSIQFLVVTWLPGNCCFKMVNSSLILVVLCINLTFERTILLTAKLNKFHFKNQRVFCGLKTIFT